MNALSKKMPRRALVVAVGFLAFVGIAASATFSFREPINPGFLAYPTIVGLHVVLGAIFLALAPLQFVGRIRSRRLAYHRRAGRLIVSVGLVVGATALFMGLVIPAGGWASRVVVGFFGALFLFALAKAFLHIRARRVALHREWMIRAFAIGLAIATQRLIFKLALLVTMTDSTEQPTGMLSATAFTVAFLVNASVAEVWIRISRWQRVRRGPERGFSAPATGSP